MKKYSFKSSGKVEALLQHIGTRIRQNRMKKNLSLEELGLECGMNHELIEKMERGGVDFGLLDVYAIAHALNMDVKEMLP